MANCPDNAQEVCLSLQFLTGARSKDNHFQTTEGRSSHLFQVAGLEIVGLQTFLSDHVGISTDRRSEGGGGVGKKGWGGGMRWGAGGGEI